MKKKVLILFLLAVLIFVIYRELPYGFSGKADEVFDYLIQKNEDDGNFEAVEKFYLKQIKFGEFWYKRFDIFKLMNNVPKSKNHLINFYISHKMYNKAEKLLIAKFDDKYIVPMNGIVHSDKRFNLAENQYQLAMLYNHLKDYKKAYQYATESIKAFENYPNNNDILINSKLIELYFLMQKLENIKNNTSDFWLKKAVLYNKKANLGADYNIHLSDYYFDKGDYTKAKNILINAYSNIEILPMPFGSPLKTLGFYNAQIKSRLGFIYQKQRKYLKADRAFLDSYYINQSLYGDYDADTLCSLYYVVNNMEYTKDKNNNGYEYHINELLELSSKYKVLEKITRNNYKETMEKFCI